MIQFQNIILHNFGSYGHAEVSLESKGFCLVTGRNNYKQDNAFSNGSGKSFLWSAICFTITGETINGLRTNLRNINTPETDKESYTELKFNYGNASYLVTRYLSPKSDLKIIKNGEDISGKGIRDSEKILASELPDLNKDLIASTIIIGQGMPNKFSSFSPSGRKELLEKLTKSDFMIEDLKKRVADRMTVLNDRKREAEDSLLVNTTKLNSISSQLAQAEEKQKNKVRPDFDKDIEKSMAQINKIKKDLQDVTIALKSATEDKDKNNTSLLQISGTRGNEVQNELTRYSTELNNTTIEESTLKVNINSLSQEINKLKSITDICPTCGQKLQNVVKPDTTLKEQELSQLKEKLNICTSKKEEMLTKHNKILADIELKYKSQIVTLENNINELTKNINSFQDTSNDYYHWLNTENEKYNKLVYEKNNWDSEQQKLKFTIENLQKEEASLSNAIKLTDINKHDISDHLAVVRKMETLLKRDFRGYLLTNIISYINDKSKDYCEIVFGTRDLEIYLDGNALDISYNNKMFDNLSGGEKQRVDLILQFAIRDMLMKYLNLNSNMLVLDEITDFLDKQSCSAVMKLIETELNTIESVFIISHHAEELELPIDSELHVIKNEEGISEVF